jgi:hypothetical protein
MRLSFAVIIAGGLIAIAVLITFRWEISAAANEAGGIVYRLDRWTGEIVGCGASFPCLPVSREQ